jgi:hypothetical protein
METVSTEEEIKRFEQLENSIKLVDYSQLKEIKDLSRPNEIFVCAGNSCEYEQPIGMSLAS